MKVNKDIIALCQVILGIFAVILAMPIGAMFDQAAVSFDVSEPVVIEPNVVQSFQFQNLSSSHNVEHLRYAFDVDGSIADFRLTRGRQLIANPSKEFRPGDNSANLFVERLPPRVRVSGAIIYQTSDPTSVTRMGLPIASAYRMSPDQLVLRDATPLGTTLRWIITGGLWLVASSLMIVYPFYRTISRVRSLEEEARLVPELRQAMESLKALSSSSSIPVISSGERIALESRKFAEEGEDFLYCFRLPLGSVCFREGFDNFLRPALENVRISKIRFILDAQMNNVSEAWTHCVLPLIEDWAKAAGRNFVRSEKSGGGCITEHGSHGKCVEWIFVDLTSYAGPSFKIFLDDPSTPSVPEKRAHVHLSFAERKVDIGSGDLRDVETPTVIARVEGEENSALLEDLAEAATEWDSLFSESGK